MKTLFENYKNIIIIIIVLIVGYIAFQFIPTQSAPTNTLDANVVSAGKDVVDLSNSIKSATLDDTKLVSSDSYKLLKDFSTDITMQPIGRKNPFAPIGTETGQIIPTPSAPATQSKTATKK